MYICKPVENIQIWQKLNNKNLRLQYMLAVKTVTSLILNTFYGLIE